MSMRALNENVMAVKNCMLPAFHTCSEISNFEVSKLYKSDHLLVWSLDEQFFLSLVCPQA